MLGIENRQSQAPELTGDERSLSLCEGVNAEVSGDREVTAHSCYSPGRASCVRWPEKQFVKWLEEGQGFYAEDAHLCPVQTTPASVE